MEQLKKILKSGQATIIDVRTPVEFGSGHVIGSINIPLGEIDNRLGQLRQMKNIVLCCASGGRSARAAEMLMSNGIECIDGGPWVVVNDICKN